MCSEPLERSGEVAATIFEVRAEPEINVHRRLLFIILSPYNHAQTQPSLQRARTMKTRAAVAWEAGKPLSIEEVDLAGPKEGEVLVRLVATGVCHTDAYTLSGADPEGAFPSILGHEGGGVIRSRLSE